MDKHSVKKIMASWPKWMQDYRLTSNSPQKTSESTHESQENKNKILVPS